MDAKVNNTRGEFDLGTAALEHLELLDRDDQNPLEVAAKFRTLLRSRKDPSIDEVRIDNNNRLSYPVVNWKYLRQKCYKQKFQQFISMKFHPLPSKIQSLRSPSPSIRTPCISPINPGRINYTVSTFHETSDDCLFPIADCNLLIRYKSEKIV